MIEAASKAAVTISPIEEIPVAEIGERHGLKERAMVRMLQKYGGMPYSFGTRWFIRAKSYAVVLISIEVEQNRQQ
ncbi:hypothetical protein [Luteolibacter soli]|uniref:DNA-binding protein n=1 Tax=Luteolibacter soli TaxID=3135280 RepID=A0ABU9AYC4_9BACT